jgi:hypothetical protein
MAEGKKLNAEFEEVQKLGEVRYIIHDNDDVELVTEYDTAYQIITREEILKLAEIMKNNMPKEEEYEIVLGSTTQWFTVGKKGKAFTVERAHDITSDTIMDTIYDENGELNTNEREHKEISAMISKYLEEMQ